jgi:serine phosphatase RsbU (regulator of sigma subunit)
MADNPNKVGFFHSLRTQLWLGSLGLLALTVSAISYFLIVNEKRTITRDMENTVVLQGRNLALSSQKALLHADPEIELFPLITRILEHQKEVITVTITDADNITQGDRDIANVGHVYRPDLTRHVQVHTNPDTGGHKLLPDEGLHANYDSYVFYTPVLSQQKTIGYVYLTYSKQELHDNFAASIKITLTVSAISLLLGLVLATIYFQRISRSMKTMMHGVNVMAEGNLDVKIDISTKNEFQLLANAFNDMSFRISAAQAEHIVKERMDRELEIAREIQQTLLPEDVYVPDGYDVGHYYNSAMEVGGDYFDVIRAGGSKLGLVIADVSGKGVPGLVVMAMVKIMVQNLLVKGTPPGEIVRKLNSALLGNIRRNMFVTFFVAILDSDTGSILFSNAGHNPAMIYNHDSGRARFFKMEGPPMGTFPDEIFAGLLHEYRLDLQPGDMLLQYTDGLNESINPDGDQFTLNRVLEIANEFGHEGAESLVGRLVRAEAAFRGSAPQFDDLTLLAVSLAADGTAVTGEAKVGANVAENN